MSLQALQDLDRKAVLSTVLIKPMDQQNGQPRKARRPMAKKLMVATKVKAPVRESAQAAPYKAPMPTPPRTTCSVMDLLAKRSDMAIGLLRALT
jgi:hypothetical protein